MNECRCVMYVCMHICVCKYCLYMIVFMVYICILFMYCTYVYVCMYVCMYMYCVYDCVCGRYQSLATALIQLLVDMTYSL